MEALGMIETRGLVVLTEASGATIKVARVKLVGVKQIGGGLVTAMVRGDVAACEAAANVGAAATQRIDELASVYVIPRPYGDLEEVFPISFKGDSNDMQVVHVAPQTSLLASPSLLLTLPSAKGRGRLYLGYATEACMKLAIVVGQIVCTVHHQGPAHDKLLMVKMIDAQGNPGGQCAIAIDSIGAGTEEWVLLVGGSSVRQARRNESSPVNPCMIGIVDEVVTGGQVIFHKQGRKS